MTLLFLIITPLIAALASMIVRKRTGALELIAAIAAPVEIISALIAINEVSLNKSYTYNSFFSIDALSAIILLITTTIGFATAFYSIGYIREEVRKQIIDFHKIKEYYILFHLFLTVMFLAIVTVNPVIMWLAVEGTTLSTAFLISFYNKQSSMEAAWKYLIINTIGLLLAFFGTILYFTASQNLISDKLIDWQTLSLSAALLNPLLAKIAFIFIVIGYGTKAGLAPMHTWLPDAHSKAPPPISALLSGALLNIALMAILRFKGVTDLAVGTTFSHNLLMLFGITSIAIPAFIIIVQKNYKRLFAYSSIEHMGIITLGFAFGGLGTFAALLHMIYHSLTKSILFFSAGNIFLKYSSTSISNIKGVLTTMPTTGVILLLGFLAITGIPPFGMFITEFNILSAGIVNYPYIVIIVLIALILIFIGFLKTIVKMALGPKTETIQTGELNYFTVIPPVFLLCLLIILSVFLPSQIKILITSAVDLIN